MSVLEPASGESFIVRVWKSLTTNPAIRWANTYELRLIDDASNTELLEAAELIQGFEVAIHLETTQFLYRTISTWEPDSHPYSPNAFTTVPTIQTGSRILGGAQPADLRVCLLVRRQVQTGFLGKLEYRNCVALTELLCPAGSFTLNPSADVDDDFIDALESSNIGNHFITGPSSIKLAMIGTAEVTRFLSDLTLGGVTVVKLNHKYFNRAPVEP